MITCDTKEEMDLIESLVDVALRVGGKSNLKQANQVIASLKVKEEAENPEETDAR